MQSAVQFLSKSFDITLGKFSLPVPYWEAVSIVVLIFLLILTLAQVRKHYVDWSLKGGIAGIFFGFLLALILEGFLIIGGRTAITEVLGWKNAPKPISVALDAGREKLIKVLGAQTQIPSSYAKSNMGVKEVVGAIQSLNPAEIKKVKSIICTP